MKLLQTIGNLVASFFYLLALGLTQIGNMFAIKRGG